MPAVLHDDLTREQAVSLAKSKWWENKTNDEVVRFQLFTARMCMPFDRFHKAVEKALKRSVWTHEFAFVERLQEEYLGKRAAPTFAEIVELIPAEKRVIVVLK